MWDDEPKKTISLDELVALEQEEQQKQSASKGLNNIKQQEEQSEEQNRYYLPVLSLNDKTVWEPQPRSARKHFTDKLAKETCLGNCCGVPGLKAACCRLDPDDLEHVLGPVTEKWISKILKHFRKKGLNLKREDVVIDEEEGRLLGNKFFDGHKIFFDPKSYPMLRFQAMGPRFGCKFLNHETGLCNIYEHRPNMCRKYYCQYVKTRFLVRTPDKPNTYRRIDIEEREKDEQC